MNIQIRVRRNTGWAALLSGESQGRAVDRGLTELNERGYRVVFITPDKWSLFRHLLNFLHVLVTLGISGRAPNILIVGELIDSDREAQPIENDEWTYPSK